MPFCSKKKSLTWLTGICACVGFLILCISVATDFWLYTFERDSIGNNGTNLIAMHSGLWRKCFTTRFLPGITKKTLWNENMVVRVTSTNCSYISYLIGKPEGSGDLKPTESIIYDMRPSAFFPLSGLLFLMIGCILSFINYCDRKIKVLIFIGGGLYVFSGICMLIGIVLYVGSISQAFDSKSSGLETESKYVYNYGGSFYLSVIAFVLSEFAGIFAVYLYIAKHKHHLRIKRERLLGNNGGLLEIAITGGDGTISRNSLSGAEENSRRQQRNTSVSPESPRRTVGGCRNNTIDDGFTREEFPPVLGSNRTHPGPPYHILTPHLHHPACGMDADHRPEHMGGSNTIGGQTPAGNSSYQMFYPTGRVNLTHNTIPGGLMTSSNDSANDPYGFDYEYHESSHQKNAARPPAYQSPPLVTSKRHHNRHQMNHQHNSIEGGLPISMSVEFGSQCNCAYTSTSTSLPRLNPDAVVVDEMEIPSSPTMHSFAGSGSGGLRSQKITSV